MHTRYLFAGVLAGLCLVATLLLLLVLLMLSAGIFATLVAVAQASPGHASLWATFTHGFLQSLQALPTLVGSAAWAFLGMGGLGLGLSAVDLASRRVRLRGRTHLRFALLAGVATALLSAIQFVQDDPGTIAVALSLALAIALGLHVAWGSWQAHWLHWLAADGAPRTPAPQRPPRLDARAVVVEEAAAHWCRPPSTAAGAAAPIRSYERPDRAPQALIVRLLVGWVLVTLLGFGVWLLYAHSAAVISAGQLAVLATAPTDTVVVPFARAPQQISFATAGGYGSVDVRVSPPGGAGATRALVGLSLATGMAPDGSATLDLHGLAAGAYRVEVRLRDGQGGVVLYKAESAAGPHTSLGVVLGAVLGMWLALGTILGVEELINANWLDGEPLEPEGDGQRR